jgi:hypothetical protein
MASPRSSEAANRDQRNKSGGGREHPQSCLSEVPIKALRFNVTRDFVPAANVGSESIIERANQHDSD